MKRNSVQGNHPTQQSTIRKYFSIIISVLFLAILIAVIAVFNYYESIAQSRVTTNINLSGRQAELSQEIAKDVMSLNLLVAVPQEGYSENTLQESLQLTINKLSRSSQLFDQTLQAFIRGGDVVNVDGKKSHIQAISIAKARYGLENSERMWQPFNQLIQSFIQSVRDNKIDNEGISFASDYSRLFEGRLFNEMTDLNNLLTEKANREAYIAQIVNGVALIIALILFIYIVFVAVRRLIRSDNELAEARKETTDIMDTIEEGLFLIDDNLQIGTQQSAQLREILPVSNITGKALDDIVANMISAEDLINTRRFVKQLFNKRVKGKLLDDLNPLMQVKLTQTDQKGLIHTKYLRFAFNRVYEKEEIVRILVTVTDITHAVELQKQLEKERQQNEVQTEMLVKVLQVDQNLLNSFVRKTKNTTETVNTVLKHAGNSQTDLRNKLNEIFREVHSFKGEASALGFDRFVSIAEDAEDKLKLLRNKSKLSGNDFLGVAVILDKLIGLNSAIEDIQEKLIGFSSHQGNDTQDFAQSNNIMSNMDNFARQIAERQNKKVAIFHVGFEHLPTFSQQQQDLLRDIMTQLLRNAIVHGIESPQVRLEKGKSEIGQIRFAAKEENGRIKFVVKDDGAGINLDAIRSKLKSDPRFSNKNVDAFSENELYRMLFLPGLSTADGHNEDAGRGEGMSIIIDRVKQLPNGKIGINSAPDLFTQFTISFTNI